MERGRIFTGGAGVWQVLFYSCRLFDAKRFPRRGHGNGVFL